jgi:hypothetical protein
MTYLYCLHDLLGDGCCRWYWRSQAIALNLAGYWRLQQYTGVKAYLVHRRVRRLNMGLSEFGRARKRVTHTRSAQRSHTR